MPGKCNSKRCLAFNYSGWRPPLDESSIILTDAVPVVDIPVADIKAPKNLCSYCQFQQDTGAPINRECYSCKDGSEFSARPIKQRDEIRGFKADTVPQGGMDDPLTDNTESDPRQDAPEKDTTFRFKADSGKVDMSLLEYFPNALKAICAQSEHGCEKYLRGSWKDVPNARRRYTAAMWRHFLDEGPDNEPRIDIGTKEEPGSGMPHDVATAWNAMARLELRLRGYSLE